ncbi:MAG: N-acetyl sugar amidotransferase [Nitrospirae bacterium]|nr:N-acetyl sugar amidotransferase [Nitrospirota bacterium]
MKQENTLHKEIHRKYKVCTQCVMDTSDPDIQFDENGICNHCRSYDEFIQNFPDAKAREEKLANIVAEIKEWGRDKEYDCILGLSGGVDSSYVAYKSKELGLRPLIVHFDSGWNSEIAVKNIENIISKLGFDLYTFVMDWEEMRDLQLSYLKASVVNADIPQDYAFFTVLYKTAAKKNIKYYISGYNYQTEFILPRKWVYLSRDVRNLSAIHKTYGQIPLRKYPTISFIKDLYYVYHKIKRIDLLYYLDYNKQEAMKVLEENVGWRYYGGKHYESIWTRFFQGYYLPVKFNIDKRRAHLSTLVVTGQITRIEALEELKKDPYPTDLLNTDMEFVLKKLGISKQEFEDIMKSPIRNHREFASHWYIMETARRTKNIFSRLLGK